MEGEFLRISERTYRINGNLKWPPSYDHIRFDGHYVEPLRIVQETVRQNQKDVCIIQKKKENYSMLDVNANN